TNLLLIEGRRVAPMDAPAGAEGELTPAEMQRRLDATRPSFVGFAQGLRLAGLKALAAIDAKDPQGLMDAGGTIDEACEARHVTYGYPSQKVLGTGPPRVLTWHLPRLSIQKQTVLSVCFSRQR